MRTRASSGVVSTAVALLNLLSASETLSGRCELRGVGRTDEHRADPLCAPFRLAGPFLRSELEDILKIPKRPTLDQLDRSMCTYIKFCAEYHCQSRAILWLPLAVICAKRSKLELTSSVRPSLRLTIVLLQMTTSSLHSSSDGHWIWCWLLCCSSFTRRGWWTSS